jgi:anaerobic magnesium-protoporphyrin IX monomethyl ester cyclase
MKVAFVYPRIDMYRDLLGTDGYVENMSTYPPLSLAYAAAVVRKAGHEAFIIDGNILNLDLKSLCRRIEEITPDFLGFTLTAPTFHPVYRWISELRKCFDIPVITGGGLLKLYPAEVMKHEEIDYAVIGLGHDSIPQFLRAYEEKNDLRGIPGLCFRQGKELVVTPPSDTPENLDDLPFPARDLLPIERYHSPFSAKRNFTPFLTSRGCLFKCAYCCLPGQMRMRKPAAVIEELEECYHRFKIRDFDMYDTVFTADKNRVLELCAQIRERKLKISWMARTPINLVDEEILGEMAASGCRMLMYGIESADEGILKNLGRPVITFDQVRDNIRMTGKAGIAAFGFFMLGSPGETEETALRTMRVSRSLGLDFAHFTRFIPIGGTPLYEKYKQIYGQDYWSGVVTGTAGGQELYPLETALSNSDILRLVRKANKGFYFHPLQIFRIISRVRSPRQMLNFIKAGKNILFSLFFSKIPH